MKHDFTEINIFLDWLHRGSNYSSKSLTKLFFPLCIIELSRAFEKPHLGMWWWLLTKSFERFKNVFYASFSKRKADVNTSSRDAQLEMKALRALKFLIENIFYISHSSVSASEL